MQDESPPPRKTYGFKPREFERANTLPPSAPADALPPAPDPGIVAADTGKIDINDLIRAGTGKGSPLSANAVVNRANEVHDLLRANHERDVAAGHFDLGVLDDSKRLRRIRNYWLGFAAINLPLGGFAFKIGHEMAIPFVCAISAMALLTTLLTWKTFFLRTHY